MIDTPCGSHKQSMIIWILLTICIGLLCQVRDTVAVKCFQCVARKFEGKCFLEDSVEKEKDCSTDGCITFRVSPEGLNLIQDGGRQCLTQNYLDCIRTHTGLDMTDARCLKTIVEWETYLKINYCLEGKVRQRANGQEKRSDSKVNLKDMWICTCEGDLCNKAEIWKPNEFKVEKAVEVGGSSSEKGDCAASRRPQISAAAWPCITIGTVFLTLCPFH